jgi:pimeloyl-ACP methyl ester carboxylesterase
MQAGGYGVIPAQAGIQRFSRVGARLVEGRNITLAIGAKKRLDCREWPRPARAGTALALVSDERSPDAWNDFAGLLASQHRVVALPAEARHNLPEVMKALGRRPALVAHGAAVREAFRLAVAGPQAVSALVVADYAPGPGPSDYMRVNVPVMVLRGRQSVLVSHAGAVSLHEAIANSRLIEPEDCGDWPFGSCPGAAAEAVRWFIAELFSPYLDFAIPGAGEPVDPRSLRR